jgi:hypothetical protein
MTNHILKMAALSVALLVGTAGIGGYAAEVNVLGGNGNIASVGGDAQGNNALATVGSTNGPLATANNTGDATNGGSNTNGAVNLGSLLNGIGGAGNGNGAGNGAGNGGAKNGGNIISGSGFSAMAANLSAGDRATLKHRCRNVMQDPTIYKDDVVTLCRLVAKL